jgi:hypothetical protein
MGEKQEQEHHAIHGIVESCQKLADKGGSITMINRQLCGGGGGVAYPLDRNTCHGQS